MQSFGVGLSAVVGAVGGAFLGMLAGERLAPTFSSGQKKRRYGMTGALIGLPAGIFIAAALATPSCPAPAVQQVGTSGRPRGLG